IAMAAYVAFLGVLLLALRALHGLRLWQAALALLLAVACAALLFGFWNADVPFGTRWILTIRPFHLTFRVDRARAWTMPADRLQKHPLPKEPGSCRRRPCPQIRRSTCSRSAARRTGWTARSCSARSSSRGTSWSRIRRPPRWS